MSMAVRRAPPPPSHSLLRRLQHSRPFPCSICRRSARDFPPKTWTRVLNNMLATVRWWSAMSAMKRGWTLDTAVTKRSVTFSAVSPGWGRWPAHASNLKLQAPQLASVPSKLGARPKVRVSTRPCMSPPLPQPGSRCIGGRPGFGTSVNGSARLPLVDPIAARRPAAKPLPSADRERVDPHGFATNFAATRKISDSKRASGGSRCESAQQHETLQRGAPMCI